MNRARRDGRSASPAPPEEPHARGHQSEAQRPERLRARDIIGDLLLERALLGAQTGAVDPQVRDRKPQQRDRRQPEASGETEERSTAE